MSKRDGRVGAPSRTSLSEQVIEAVATAEGVPPEELCPPEYEPLHDAIDPEALNALFADRYNNAPRASGTVSFMYCNYRVTVTSDGAVELE